MRAQPVHARQLEHVRDLVEDDPREEPVALELQLADCLHQVGTHEQEARRLLGLKQRAAVEVLERRGLSVHAQRKRLLRRPRHFGGRKLVLHQLDHLLHELFARQRSHRPNYSACQPL